MEDFARSAGNTAMTLELVGVLDNRQDDQQIQDKSEEADDTEHDSRKSINNRQSLFLDYENIVRKLRFDAQIGRHFSIGFQV